MAYLMERAHSLELQGAGEEVFAASHAEFQAAAAKLLHYAADARGDYARALDGHHRATAYAHRLAAEDDQREPAPSVTRGLALVLALLSRTPRAPRLDPAKVAHVYRLSEAAYRRAAVVARAVADFGAPTLVLEPVRTPLPVPLTPRDVLRVEAALRRAILGDALAAEAEPRRSR